MGEQREDDGLDTPGWMHLLVNSPMTARVLAKAHRDGESLRDARASTDPRSAVFIDGMRDRAEKLRERWQPGLTEEWWTTASRGEAMDAYVAALDGYEIDEHAARAADQFRAWFAGSD